MEVDSVVFEVSKQHYCRVTAHRVCVTSKFSVILPKHAASTYRETTVVGGVCIAEGGLADVVKQNIDCCHLLLGSRCRG